MPEKSLSKVEEIVNMTGFKKWKVSLVLGNNSTQNMHRVTDEETAIILHAAAEIGYVNPGKGSLPGRKVKDVTLEVVAKRAGVSPATVYQALIVNSIEISKETRAHVLRIVKELGYVPTKKKQLKNFYSKKI